ncbi:MAG: type VI secretion system tube protein Hcp [Gammaproteobacteria bacterium]|nr:type VI secretion system tube protein Hcp [Gammaproteobacteria bacterium]
MADITVKIEQSPGTISITGESNMDGHVDELEAIAVRDLIVAPTGTSKARLSEIFLTRYRDKASPKLAEACSLGENIGTATVFLFKNTEDGPKVYLQYTLTDTFVSRIEHETAEANGTAYMPHQGYSNLAGHSYRTAWNQAGLTQNADRRYARARANPVPLYPLPIGSTTNDEVERLWLNAATVTWTYTPYDGLGAAGGAIEKGWNLQTSVAL